MGMFKEFVGDVKEVVSEKAKTVDLLRKSNDNLIIFWGGSGAKEVYDFLMSQGIGVSGFCESNYFYRDGKTIDGKKVFLYEDVDRNFKSYNLVLAASGPSIADALSKNCTRRKNIYVIDTFEPLFHMSSDWVRENSDALSETYDMLEDELSKVTMLSFIDSKAHCIKGDVAPLWRLYQDSQYFNSFYDPNRYEVNALIDCGAWIGDTAEEFLNMVRESGHDGKVYSFEPDNDNYEELLKTAKRVGDIVCYKYAVGNKREKLFFAAGNTSQSHISTKNTGVIVEAVPVDELLLDKSISMVKMDLEGAEIAALEGMKGIITEQMPHLAICVYHKIDDLITIPRLIQQYAEENGRRKYKYYLRQHSCFGIETVFYAVPQ